MAAKFFCKTDENTYRIKGQLLKESVLKNYTCLCALKHFDTEDENICSYCNNPIFSLTWDKISKFMTTGKSYRNEIATIIRKKKLSPLNNFNKTNFGIKHYVEKFLPNDDTNAFVVAVDENKKWYLYMFVTYKKIKNNKEIDEVELTVVTVDKQTILTPNWNYNYNPWTNKTSKKKFLLF